MDKNSKRMLLFDIDGTLLDPAGIGHLCYQRAMRDILGTNVLTDPVQMAGRTDWEIVNDFLFKAGLDQEQIELHRESVFDAFIRHIAIVAPSSRMHALPGVLTLLNQLADDPRFILGLVTGNLRQVAVFKLEKARIKPDLFIFGAFGDEHQDRNQLPALALYRLGQMLGYPIPAEAVLVIGDTPHDIACARHTGLKVLCVATGIHKKEDLAKYQPDYLLKDLSDTEGVMEIFENF